MYAGSLRDQKKVLNPPKLGLQVVSHLIWMLGTKLKSFAKAVSTLSCQSPLQFKSNFKNVFKKVFFKYLFNQQDGSVNKGMTPTNCP